MDTPKYEIGDIVQRSLIDVAPWAELEGVVLKVFPHAGQWWYGISYDNKGGLLNIGYKNEPENLLKLIKKPIFKIGQKIDVLPLELNIKGFIKEFGPYVNNIQWYNIETEDERIISVPENKLVKI